MYDVHIKIDIVISHFSSEKYWCNYLINTTSITSNLGEAQS